MLLAVYKVMSDAGGGGRVCEGRERWAAAADPGLHCQEQQPAAAKANSDRGSVKKRNR